MERTFGDSKFEVRGYENPELQTSNIIPQTNSGVGWDIPLDHPERFVEAIEYCTCMSQEEYDTMSRRAFEYAKQVTEDVEVLEANKRLFN